MDGRRPAEDLTALEREIEAALAVDPSPEFVARIRTRIGSEPAPASWWQLRWPILAGAVVASVVMMAVALSWQPAVPAPITGRRGADVVLPAGTPAPARPPLIAVQADRIRPRTATTTAYVRRVQPFLSRQAEVLVSRDEQRAFAMLVTAVQEGRFQRALAPAANAAEVSAEPMDISITPLVIEPLQQIAALGGEEQ